MLVMHTSFSMGGEISMAAIPYVLIHVKAFNTVSDEKEESKGSKKPVKCFRCKKK